MSKTIRIVRTIYLYLATFVSLIFVAVGLGTLVNTGLKAALFQEAEKKSYFECNQQPPIASVISKEQATEDQKVQIDALLKDYENWKENQSGDKCMIPARQNKLIDAITMIIIALPIFLFHWRIAKKEKDEK